MNLATEKYPRALKLKNYQGFQIETETDTDIDRNYAQVSKNGIVVSSESYVSNAKKSPINYNS